MEDRIQGFLQELNRLSKKYGVYVGGCGCCGSPYLYNAESNDFKVIMEYLKYNDESKQYTVEEVEEDRDEINRMFSELEEDGFTKEYDNILVKPRID